MLPNGTIIKSERFVPHAYESLAVSDQQNINPDRYVGYTNWYNALTSAQVSKITYMSDGLQVVGLIAQPTTSAGKLPVVIYNRGGSNDDGKINVTTIKNMIHPLVQAGYIVVASQYRGNDGGQGKDEGAGADVNDVLALFETINRLPNADTNNIFMVGYSRGAMNSYCALKAGLQVNAIAVMAGVADLVELCQMRPPVKLIMESMIPNSSADYDAACKKRSVMFWPEAVNAPLLLLHGAADQIIDVSQSQQLAKKLDNLGKPYHLIIFQECDHFFGKFRDVCAQEIIKWFAHYKK